MNMPNPGAGLPLRVEWGVAAKALPGQRESGDLYLVEEIPEGWLFAVVDGEIVLLHGFIKKQQKTPPDELDLAKKRKKQYLQKL